MTDLVRQLRPGGCAGGDHLSEQRILLAGEGPVPGVQRLDDAHQTRRQGPVDQRHVPASSGTAAAALRDLMAEADAYCRQGEHLVTLTSPADVTAFRCWFLDEL